MDKQNDNDQLGCFILLYVAAWWVVLPFLVIMGCIDRVSLMITRYVDRVKWRRWQAERWLFSTPKIIKFANKASGRQYPYPDGRYIQVLGLLAPSEEGGWPDAVVCKISNTKPEKLKPWPILKNPSDCLIYKFQPNIEDLEMVLLQSELDESPKF